MLLNKIDNDIVERSNESTNLETQTIVIETLLRLFQKPFRSYSLKALLSFKARAHWHEYENENEYECETKFGRRFQCLTNMLVKVIGWKPYKRRAPHVLIFRKCKFEHSTNWYIEIYNNERNIMLNRAYKSAIFFMKNEIETLFF